MLLAPALSLKNLHCCWLCTALPNTWLLLVCTNHFEIWLHLWHWSILLLKIVGPRSEVMILWGGLNGPCPISTTSGTTTPCCPTSLLEVWMKYGKFFFQPGRQLISLHWRCCLALLLLLVLSERTLRVVVTELTTSEAFDLWQVLLLMFPLPLTGTLRC